MPRKTKQRKNLSFARLNKSQNVLIDTSSDSDDGDYCPKIADCQTQKFKAIKHIFDVLVLANNGVFKLVALFVYLILE